MDKYRCFDYTISRSLNMDILGAFHSIYYINYFIMFAYFLVNIFNFLEI